MDEKVANQRTGFLNKLSIEIIKNHNVICIEDLNTKGLLRNHKLAKSNANVLWSEVVAKLTYKVAWHGRELITVDRFYLSSQICSAGGHR